MSYTVVAGFFIEHTTRHEQECTVTSSIQCGLLVVSTRTFISLKTIYAHYFIRVATICKHAIYLSTIYIYLLLHVVYLFVAVVLAQPPLPPRPPSARPRCHGHTIQVRRSSSPSSRTPQGEALHSPTVGETSPATLQLEVVYQELDLPLTVVTLSIVISGKKQGRGYQDCIHPCELARLHVQDLFSAKLGRGVVF